MNTRRHIKPVTVLGLGLFTALVAGGLLVSRRNPATDIPAPKQEPTVPSRAAEQAAQRVNQAAPALQPVELAREAMRTMSPVVHESGYEIPFASTNTAPADPAQLRAALTAAVAAGNVRELAVLLHSGNPASEIEAVRILAQIGGGDALAAALGKILTVPADSPDYNRFINAFANCRSAAVADWLTGFLGQTQTEDVRQRVLTLLAALRGPEVVNSLAASLARPLDAMHAEDCAELLAKSSDPEQAAVLRNLLENGKSAEIQTAAARGLASVGSGAACDTLIKMGSSSEAAAKAALDALAKVKSSYAQKELFDALVNPATPPPVLIAILQALETQPGQRTETVLENVAASDPAVQAAINQTLQTIKQSGTPPPSGSALGNAAKSGEIWF